MTTPVPRSSAQSSGWLINGIIWFGILLVVALPVGLIVGGLQSRHQVEPVAGGVTTVGKVSSVDSREALHGRIYTPTISFTDRAGHVHLFDGPSGADSPAIGTTVKVSYDPNNPDHASDLSAGSAVWKVPFWIGVALAVVEIPAFVWVRRRRRMMRGLQS